MQSDCACFGSISEISRSLPLHHWKFDVSVFWTAADFQSSYRMFKHTQTLCGSMLAEVLPPAEQLEMQKTLTSFGTFGFVAGPAIAGNMLELHRGYQRVCYIITVIFLINFAIVYIFLQNSAHERRNEEGDNAMKLKTSSPNVKSKKNMESMSSIRKAKEHDIRRKRVSEEILQSVTDLLCINWTFYWDVFALKFLFDFTQTVHLMNFAPVLRDVYNTAPRWIGYTVALQGMVGTMSSFLIEWISIFYKYDTNYTQRGLHGFGLFALSFLCLSLAPNWTYMFIFLLPLSMSMSLLKSATAEMMRQRTVLDKKMPITGLGQSVFSAARLFAPVCTGLIYDMYGFQGTSVLKIVAAGIATALSYFIFLRQVQDKKKM
ncbi:major facilitator superfamily domain-containing protein 9 isoform X3 [Cryptotermes secundus]|uniref:major facilitator superfamily domain-containing protein 9 isoform X3 n=1 Tax=Cryptotermes secundus TaxID=105785 RepID=UPI000CD7D40A|nr:major facilitator superfamily domain-containing protein 9 isoform X3 [Cryptotermes secundus]